VPFAGQGTRVLVLSMVPHKCNWRVTAMSSFIRRAFTVSPMRRQPLPGACCGQSVSFVRTRRSSSRGPLKRLAPRVQRRLRDCFPQGNLLASTSHFYGSGPAAFITWPPDGKALVPQAGWANPGEDRPKHFNRHSATPSLVTWVTSSVRRKSRLLACLSIVPDSGFSACLSRRAPRVGCERPATLDGAVV
jgi:hypothetical protein